MRIALTGATGFIGSKLTARLMADGHTLRILARHPRENSDARLQWFPWDTGQQPPRESLEGVDAVIHLAGEPIAQRWSAAAKEKIRTSRIQGTENLVAAMRDLTTPPRTLVSASAIGFYGSRGDEILTEDSAPGSDFLASVCVDWERAAHRAESLGTRVVMLRNGIVLGCGGGALRKMLPPFRAGAGGRIGSGKQWMSWIHIDDLCGLIDLVLRDKGVRGPINATGPQPVTNEVFTRQLAEALHRPAIFPVPAFALRLLFGEMSEVMLGSLRVLPNAAETAGYQFAHPELSGALRQILS